MKNLSIIIVIFLFSATFSAAQDDRYPFLDCLESELYLGGILDLDPQPQNIGESYNDYVNHSAIYIKSRDTNPPTKDSVKVFLFTVMMGELRNAVATGEAAYNDTFPLMKKNPELFFQVVADLPFLTEYACSSLNGYFNFYQNPGKKEFIENYKPIIRKYLPNKYYNVCLNEMEKE
jgi:hypothetical protein